MTQESNANDPKSLDPTTAFVLAQLITSAIMAVTSMVNPTYGQLDALYKKKGLL